MEERAPPAYARLVMSADADSTRSAPGDAAAALDLLLTDAATGMLRRVNPGGWPAPGLPPAVAVDQSRPGDHLELGANSERLASAVEAFLNADLTAEGSQQ